MQCFLLIKIVSKIANLVIYLLPFVTAQVVGNTTSGCFSPATGKGLVFAYVPRILDVPGLEAEVEIMGKMCKAKVLEGPPVLTQATREKAAAKEKLATAATGQ